MIKSGFESLNMIIQLVLIQSIIFIVEAAEDDLFNAGIIFQIFEKALDDFNRKLFGIAVNTCAEASMNPSQVHYQYF